MKIKKLLVLLISILLIFTLTACAGDNSEQTQESSELVEVSEEDLDSEEIEEETEVEETENWGKRSNPVPVGEWVEFQDTYYESIESMDPIEATLKLRITEVERGDVAYEQLVDENQFNEPAPEGNEWIIVNFEIEMLDGDEDVPYTVAPHISVMTSTGSGVPQDDYGTLDGNEFGYVDLFPGGTHSGRDTFYIPVEDESLLVYDVGFDSSIYFSITE